MESDLDIIMHYHGCHMDACGNGWSLIWTLSWLAHGYHGWPMDALRERMEPDLDFIMVATWMLCGNGWNWTLTWLAPGCSA
eukprot:s2602_g14.t1